MYSSFLQYRTLHEEHAQYRRCSHCPCELAHYAGGHRRQAAPRGHKRWKRFLFISAMYAASYACDVNPTASSGGRRAGNRTGCRRTVDPGKYLLFAWGYGEGKTRDGAYYGGSRAV